MREKELLLAVLGGVTRKQAYKLTNTPITKCKCCYRVIPFDVHIKRTHNKFFCSSECKAIYLESMGKGEQKLYQEASRNIVNRAYTLKPKQVVHHHDRNHTNNNITNLCVFENHADHMKYHWGASIIPIWDGAKLISTPKPIEDFII